MQIQDIEVVVLILSLVFRSNMVEILLQVTCSVKNHIKCYIFIRKPIQCRQWGTSPSLVTLLVFIFRVIVPLLPNN